MIVSPDGIYVDEIKLSCRDKDAIAITYVNGEIYIYKGLHPTLYESRGITKEGFDFRIWTDSKICTFWPCKDCFYLLVSANELLKPKYNLEEYTFYYTLNKNIHIVKWNSILKLSNTNIIPDRPIRLWNLNSRRIIKTEWERYWLNRIGDMDVAEWHLLMYEE